MVESKSAIAWDWVGGGGQVVGGGLTAKGPGELLEVMEMFSISLGCWFGGVFIG